jgi:hypothetical protein
LFVIDEDAKLLKLISDIGLDAEPPKAIVLDKTDNCTPI